MGKTIQTLTPENCSISERILLRDRNEFEKKKGIVEGVKWTISHTCARGKGSNESKRWGRMGNVRAIRRAEQNNTVEPPLTT